MPDPISGQDVTHLMNLKSGDDVTSLMTGMDVTDLMNQSESTKKEKPSIFIKEEKDPNRSLMQRLMEPNLLEADTSGPPSLLTSGIDVGANVPILNKIWPGGVHIPGLAETYNELVRPMSSLIGLGTMGLEGAINRFGPSRSSSIGTEGESALPKLASPEVAAEKPLPKLLGPATTNLESTIGIPTGELPLKRPLLGTAHEERLNTGKPAELLHPNRMEPASEILHPYVQEAAAKNPEVKAVVDTAINSGEPVIAKATTSPEFIKKYVEPISEEKATRNTPTKRVAAGLGSSIDTELTKQSPILGEVVKKVQVDSAIKAGTWTTEFDNIVKNLSDTEFSKLVNAIEDKVELDPATDAKLIKAKARYEVLDKEVSRNAAESGMGLKSSDGTKTVPWQPRPNYWPHLYTEEFFNELRNNPTKVRDLLAQKGMAPLEIDNLLANSKRFGERFINAQHGREADLPGYRIDRNVYREHLDEMARRITEANYYGAMDLADSGSPLMNLIKETNNPEYTTGLMKKLLNRDVKGNQDFNVMTRKAMGIQAWLHLGTSGISNMNTVAMPYLQTNARSFIRGLTDTIVNSQKTGEFTESAGAIRNIFKEIFAQTSSGHTFNPTKLYGLDAEERFMRTVSAATGRAYAKQLFNELKNNPNNVRASTQLRNLVLEDPANLIKQPELNDLQIKRAAFRVSELSQGLADKQNLPQFWTGSGLSNLLTLFHKYQFAQTKIIKDAIMSNPVRSIPILFAMSQIAGEITGDVKAGVRGSIKAAWSGDSDKIGNEIKDRQKWLAGKLGLDPDSLTARMAENAAQSFALGIYADVLEAMGGNGSDALIQLAGSTVGDLIKIFNIGKNTISGIGEATGLKPIPENRRDTTLSPLGRAGADATSLLPIVGPPIASELRHPD